MKDALFAGLRDATATAMAAATFGALAAGLAACKDTAKESAARAAAHATALAELAGRDVEEIDRGLPEGARRIGAQLAPDAGAGGEPSPVEDASTARAALRRVRRDVPDLQIAKSTFFAMADARLVGIRNDLEQDAMAGLDLTKGFPALARATREGVYVTATGAFPGTHGDRDWLAAAPIKRADGTVAGALVTGWSYRIFARHLQEALMKELRQKAQDEGSKVPIVYVAVFDATGVYAAPLTPKVNEQALAEADLPARTAAGAFQAPMAITGRDFGVGAARVAKLGEATGVAVMRSEL